MGHTPGPWRSTHYNAVLKSCNFFAIEADGYCGQIAEVDDDTKDAEANARLIAAAPDLLKVAKLMRDRLTILANIADCCWNDWEYSYLVDDVIAKAEGRD